ncbi:unnamed protein product [Linum trigynum]|uniref:Uncharacterized protein n=1 Tax=Linum trigynum TaxID=586398 RepID=A0AAV2CLM2_9ROSI
MVARDGRNRRKKSLCEKSMELAVNIFNCSFLYLAALSFKPTPKLPTPPPPPAGKRRPNTAAGDRDGLLSSFAHQQNHQQARRPHKKKPVAAGVRLRGDGDKADIDERASSFIRRIKERNQQAYYYWEQRY